MKNYYHIFKGFTLFWGLVLFASPSFAASTSLNASIIRVEIPHNMVVDRKYRAKIEVKNTGAVRWTAKRGYSLGLSDQASRAWGKLNIKLSGNESVKPGESKVFEIRVKAPSSTGLFPLSWQMNKNGTEFGEATAVIDVVVETVTHRGKFISQVIPQNMQAGKTYDVVFQYKNVGNAAWSQNDDYQLAINKRRYRNWGISRIILDDSNVVPPGDVATFRAQLTAPDKPGAYSMQWRMLKGKKNWFGDPTPLLKINVQQGMPDMSAEFVFQNVPGIRASTEYFSIFKRGEVYPVTLTFKNNGTKPWNPGRTWLASRVRNSEFIWSIENIQLKTNEVVLPGEMKSFSFNVMAPLDPGIYDFQWQMKAGDNDWIGEPTDKVVITVK